MASVEAQAILAVAESGIVDPVAAAAFALGFVDGAAVPPKSDEPAPALKRSPEDTKFLEDNYPKNLEEVKPEWVGVLLGYKVTGLSIKKKLEAGVTGDAAIFNIAYAEGSKGPPSIVLKYAKDQEQSRKLAQEAHMYEKEVYLYGTLHEVIAEVLPIPKVFGTFVDPEKPQEFFCIAMEDLSVDFEPMDQIIGISLDEAKRLAPLVAQLHAKFWNSETLKLPVINNGEENKANIWYESWLDQFIANPHVVDVIYDNFLTNDKIKHHMDLYPTVASQDMVRAWKQHGKALQAAFHKILDSRPKTLTHGDMRADNLFRQQPGKGNGFMFIDWQTFASAPAGAELTQLLAGSFTKLDDLDKLDEVLEPYLAKLYEMCPAAKTYTMDMLKEDWTICFTMLYLGVSSPFAPFFDVLPAEHPLWTLFDTAFPRYIKLSKVLDIPTYTLDTLARLGLTLDESKPFLDKKEETKSTSRWHKAIDVVIATNRMRHTLFCDAKETLNESLYGRRKSLASVRPHGDE